MTPQLPMRASPPPNKTAVQTPITERSRGRADQTGGRRARRPHVLRPPRDPPCTPHLLCSPPRGAAALAAPCPLARPTLLCPSVCLHQCVPASPAAPLPEPGARWKRPSLRCRPSPPQLPPPPQAPRRGAPRRTPASHWDPPPRAPCVTLPLGHRRAVFTHCADGRPCNTGWCCPGSFVCHLAIKPLRHPVL